MMSGRSWSSMRAISSLRASFFFLRRLSWRASVRPDSSSALMALSRSRCSCLSLSNVARSSRISSLSMDAPAPRCALRGQAKYHGESRAAQGFWHEVALTTHGPEVGQGDAPTRLWTLDKTSPICHNVPALDQLSRRSEYGARRTSCGVVRKASSTGSENRGRDEPADGRRSQNHRAETPKAASQGRNRTAQASDEPLGRDELRLRGTEVASNHRGDLPRSACAESTLFREYASADLTKVNEAAARAR